MQPLRVCAWCLPRVAEHLIQPGQARGAVPVDRAVRARERVALAAALAVAGREAETDRVASDRGRTASDRMLSETSYWLVSQLSSVRDGGADVGEGRVGIALDGQVSNRHDTDRLTVLHHGQPPNGLLAHASHRFVGAVGGDQGREVAAADIAQ